MISGQYLLWGHWAMKQHSLIMGLAVLLLFQDVRLAEVRGEVRDMQGRPVVAADVVYTKADSGKTYHLKTDANGQYFGIGLFLGWYELTITGPAGKQIFSGKKFLSAGEAQKFNTTEIDLSAVPSSASLAPFKGLREGELKGAREAAAQGRQLSPAQLEAVREHNRLISRYNELFPEAQSAIKAQDWHRAADLLQQLIEIAPNKWELYQNLGSTQRNLGRHADAIASFEKGLGIARASLASEQDRGKLNAAIVLISINEGEALAALHQPEAAAEKFRIAADLDPRPATAYLQLCSAEYNSGHAEAAVAACKRAITAEPLRAEAYQVLGGVQSNLEAYQDALRTYAKGIEVALGNMRAAQPSPISNISSMQYADSSRAIGEGVRAGQMMQSAGNIYFHLGKYPEAAELFRRAAGLHPYPALPLFNLCATLYDMNNFSAAASACDHAIEADSQMPDAYFVKGSALYGEAARKGRLAPSSDALTALQKYLQLAPDGLYAKDARNLLREIAGRN